jgi:hypothetical protein
VIALLLFGLNIISGMTPQEVAQKLSPMQAQAMKIAIVEMSSVGHI